MDSAPPAAAYPRTFLCDTTVLFAASDAALTLDLDGYLWVLRHVAGAEARGGQVYDALILQCAERAGVDAVFTWNTAHFMRVAWPGMAERIRTP